MRGRVYDTLAGRFATPDPIVQAPFWSQGLNRYAYVGNNPVNAVDPSGFSSFSADGDGWLYVFDDDPLLGHASMAASGGTSPVATAAGATPVATAAAPIPIAPLGAVLSVATGALNMLQTLTLGGGGGTSNAPPATPSAPPRASAGYNTGAPQQALAPIGPPPPPITGATGELTAAELARIPSGYEAPPVPILLAKPQFVIRDTSEGWKTALDVVMWSMGGVEAAGSLAGLVATRVFLREGAALAAEVAPPLLNTARGNLLQGAQNPRLRNLVQQMYRKTATVGSGSTADAIRYELRTGELLSRSGHTLKGQEMRQALLNVVKEEGLDAGDAQIANGLLNDLQRALSGL